MPGKNRVKVYAEDSYYHIYNRGVNRQDIFLTDYDYTVFINLFKRYLSKEPVLDFKKREYPWLYNDLKLLAFCLMPNHYHLLIFQMSPTAMTKLLQGVSTSYTMYFNKKYKRVGPLFQDIFKASRISNDAYLEHISRYIHLNPEHYVDWEYSSLPYYLGKKKADWLDPTAILGMFKNSSYPKFLSDFKDHRRMLKEISAELADS